MTSASQEAGSRARRRGWVYVLPLVVFLAALFLVPLARLLRLSFSPADSFNAAVSGWTLSQYGRVFTDPYFYGSLIQTGATALLVAVLCVLLAYPAAYALARRRPGVARTLLFVIVISPLLTSVVVRTYGWVVLLSGNGVVNKALVATGLRDQPAQLLTSYPAVVVAVTHVLLPFAIIPLTTALGGMDRNLHRASQTLGAGPVRTFLRVTVPLSLPGVVTGALIVFALAMGIYITPLLVGGVTQPLTGIRVYEQVSTVFDYPVAAALSFALLALTVVSTTLLAGVFRIWERRLHG
ncbi:putative spermidine/putrescine transport system permease protein [Nonomuraea solani]|uniref:Putative spermidine/putrescine transport system permease protein n=1 Tax=Nonomuraea solani TaxID=1144553 RepID=A0A1H6EW89_9ACTN|nr:ABC transporter permease [Nonomuraea solani]SEH02108.1 putative spermidine/putrescine transport system permease protein [Nonomuraea solani]